MLGVYFRKEYGAGKLDYPLIFEKERKFFDTFALRASGSDWTYTLFRDGMMQNATCDYTHIDNSGFRACVVYVNGEYLGIHNIREKIEEDYAVQNHHIPEGNVYMVENENYAEAGGEPALDAYNRFLEKVHADLSLPENWEAVAGEMDIDNFTDLIATEIWSGNTSIGHNVMAWRPKDSGKWRWILMDLDRGFFEPEQHPISFYVNQEPWPLKQLMRSNDYKHYLGRRLADHLFTTFHPGRIIPLIDRHTEWKYFDKGADPGSSWRTNTYNDDNWAVGQAELGYGDGDETTLISFGNNNMDKHITTYFRKTFETDQPDTDAIDYDEVRNVVILNCRIHDFHGFNSDAIDLGEQAVNVLIDGIFVYNITDKGVSVGQQSSATIRNSVFTNCNLGAGLKDSCRVVIDHCTYYGNRIAIASFEKNSGDAGGNVMVTNSILSNCYESIFLKDSRSGLEIRYSVSDNDRLPDHQNNLFSDPAFSNPSSFDFSLQPFSRCIMSASDGDMGANLPAVDTEPNLVISEIAYLT